MNLQESIRRILREIEEDRVQIRLGRNAERHFGTVQNIIISLDGKDITSENDVPSLGKMNIVIKDGEIIVGDIFIPEKYRRKGIATLVYQKISDYFGLPIVNSTIKGFNQTKEGGYIWKNRDNFKPRNLQENIRRILREEITEDKNLYGEKLKACSTKPMTGFYRDGYCRTGDDDTGSHTVCAEVTEEFLEFTKSMGNNLDMLEPGDKWCLCAKRWKEANEQGVAPKMIKSSTNIKTLDIIDSVEQELDEYARTLKNARKQGTKLRFPKSAIKANPQRFRKYTRDTIQESDPKTGTGKKPEGSSRRLYTDENPNDTVSVKFRTKQDIIDTLNKSSFKSKPHKRQSQIINLIHQRVRSAYQNAKDPETKKRLKTSYDYIETVKEKSKQKTIRLQKQKVNESKTSQHFNLINNLLDSFKEKDCICDIRVSFDVEDNYYNVYLVFSQEELHDKFSDVNAIRSYIRKMQIEVKNDLEAFLPIKNIFIGYFTSPNCEWSPLNESKYGEEKDIKRILREETNIKVMHNLVNMLFDGFNDMYYDWAEFNCGMGVCCDPYAIGFALPNSDYYEFIFKLVDEQHYDDDGDYGEEIISEMPKVCYEVPDIKNPNFDTIVFYQEYIEQIEDYMGHESNWISDLLKIINKQFGCDAKRIVII